MPLRRRCIFDSAFFFAEFSFRLRHFSPIFAAAGFRFR
jgi:hypothetical protein